MKIYLVWQENAADGIASVIGFCQTEEDAYRWLDKLKAEQQPKSIRWYYWFEELEELI